VTQHKATREHGPLIFSMGDQAYGHIAALALEDIRIQWEHLLRVHGIHKNYDEIGSWCRDVEAHARAHGVVLYGSKDEAS